MTDTTVHPVDEKLPAPRLAALGMQHVLVMYAGAVAVPLIIGRALQLSSEQVASRRVPRDVFIFRHENDHSDWSVGNGQFAMALVQQRGADC